MKTHQAAGTLLSGLWASMDEGIETHAEFDAFARRLCSFTIDSSVAFDATHIPKHPLYAVASNLVSRGLPTRADRAVERACAAISADVATRAQRLHALAMQWLPADPRITAAQATRRFTGGKHATMVKLVLPVLQAAFGPLVPQLLDVDEHGLLLPFIGSGWQGMRFVAPGQHPALDGWHVVEVAPDGKGLRERITAIAKESARAMRLLKAGLLAVQELKAELLPDLQLLLAPSAIARVRKALFEAVLAGVLDPGAATWRIVVLERDLPCARLAIDGGLELLRRLLLLHQGSATLPAVDLKVFGTREFLACALHGDAQPKVFDPARPLPDCDLCIDVAMLRCEDMDEDDAKPEQGALLRLRSQRVPQGQRTLRLGPVLRYAGLRSGKGAKREPLPEAEHAAVELLRDLFGVSDARPDQLALLDHALRGEQVIAEFPPAAGKTLPLLLAALLQPACTLYTAPSSALLGDMIAGVRRLGVDSVGMMHEADPHDLRLRALRAMSAGQVLLACIPAALLRSDEVRAAFDDMRKSSRNIARVVVDEAHSMSEWSHDPRLAMHDLPRRVARAVVATPLHTVPVACLTGPCTAAVRMHLREQLRAADPKAAPDEPYILRQHGVLPPACFPKVLTIAEPNGAGVAERRALLKRCLVDATAMLQECRKLVSKEQRVALPEGGMFSRPDSGHAAVVFCRDLAGVNGVSRRFMPGSEAGVAEYLEDEGFIVGRVAGSDAEGRSVGRHVLRESKLRQDAFARGETAVLVTTRTYGIGTHRPGIRLSVHDLPPLSLRQFLQEGSRAGHDGKVALAALLAPESTLGKQRLTDSERRYALTMAGFSSAAREKQVIADVLREISYPEDTNTARVSNMLTDEFGVPILATYWQRGLDERLLVQERSGRMFGHIDLVTHDIAVDGAYPDAAIAQRVLDVAYTHCMAEAGSQAMLSSWVAATFPSDVEDGIVRQMQDFEPGTSFTLHLGFENDREPILTQIHGLLWHKADIEVQRKLMSEVSTESWEIFCAQLERRMKNPQLFASLDPALAQDLRQLFLRIRTRSDTERLIARLATIGVVRDCVANPAARRFALHIAVLRDEEYHDNIARYFHLLVPKTHAERILQSLPGYEGESLLERCLAFLVDNLYLMLDDRLGADHAAMHRFLAATAKPNGGAAPLETRELAYCALAARHALPMEWPEAIARGGGAVGEALVDTVRHLESDGSLGMLDHLDQLHNASRLLRARTPRHPLPQAAESLAALLEHADAAAWKETADTFVQHAADCFALDELAATTYSARVKDVLALLQRHCSTEVHARLVTVFNEAGRDLTGRRARATTEAAVHSGPVEATVTTEEGTAAIADRTAVPPQPSEPVAPGKTSDAVAKPAAPPAQRPGGVTSGAEDTGRASTALPTEGGMADAQTAPPPAPPRKTPAAPIPRKEAPPARPAPVAQSPATPAAMPPTRAHIEGTAASVPVPSPAEEELARAVAELEALDAVTANSAVSTREQEEDSSAASAPATPAPVTPARGKVPEQRKEAPPVSRAVQTPAPPPPAKEPADPMVTRHLAWLRAFNNRFLSGYES